MDPIIPLNAMRLFAKTLLYSFMKLDERCIKFVKNVINTIPDDQMTKIKVVYLQKSYNFVVEPFLFELLLPR
jgi:hypothetical protein